MGFETMGLRCVQLFLSAIEKYQSSFLPMYMRRRMAKETLIQLVKLMPGPDERPLAKNVLWRKRSFPWGTIHAS
jgi:hypothetical protein